MNIEFTGKYTRNNNFGISFQAIVEGEEVTCVVAQEILQDLNSDHRLDSVEQQYLDNKNQLELTARNKILSGKVDENKIFIYGSDISQ